MTVLTSTGAVNLTSSTNWSPAQIPVHGDDLILSAGDTLTVDADLTLDSITVASSTTSRMVPSGTTRTLTVTNGITYSGVVGTSATGNAFLNVFADTFTLVATHLGTGNFSRFIAEVLGGTLNLTNPSGSAGILCNINSVSSFMTLVRQITGTSTLNTTGRILATSAVNGNSVLYFAGALTWNHTHTGLSVWNGSSTNNSFISIAGGGIKSIAFTGDVDGNCPGSNFQNTVWYLGGVCEVTYTGKCRGLGTGNAGIGKCVYIAFAAAIFNLQGTCVTLETNPAVAVWFAFAGTFRWRNQTAVIASGEESLYLVNAASSSLVLTSLVVQNSGKVGFVFATGTATVDGVTSIQNQVSIAHAFSNGTSPVPVINLASSPPTLPAVQNVAAGTSYGYTASPLTGTGIINDPAAIAAAMVTSFSSLPEVMVRTSIATLSSQTEFTLTAGSADNDVYNGLQAIITDQVTAVQKAAVSISDYAGSTKAVTLSSAPGFTIATGDLVTIIAGASGGGGSSFPSEAPANWLTAAGIQDGALTANKFAANALNGKGDWLLSSGYTAPDNTTIGLIYTLMQLTDSDVASILTLLGTPAGASIAADLSAIKASADAALRPTTAGRTLAVSAAGAVELDSATLAKVDGIKAQTDLLPSNIGDVLVAQGSQRAVSVDNSHRVHSHVYDMQSNVVTASALAADAVTEIQANLATSAGVTAAFTEIKGAGWSSSTDTLEKIADAAGAGSGGTGDASQTTLLEVKAKTDLIGTAAGATSLLAGAVLTPGTIVGFPSTITIGDSYTDTNGRSIRVPIVDSTGTPISTIGSLNLADASVTFKIRRAKETSSTRVVSGTAYFEDPVGTGTSEAPYVIIELSSSETAKGLLGYQYSGVLTFTWPYVGTGTDPEVVSFETGTVMFND